MPKTLLPPGTSRALRSTSSLESSAAFPPEAGILKDDIPDALSSVAWPAATVMAQMAPHVALLPPQVCASVIELVVSDRATLNACSLTCRAWHAIAVRHTFYAVRLAGIAQYTAFEKILTGAPKIAPCVRDLTIVPDEFYAQGSLDEDAPRILARLPQVVRVSFVNWSATQMTDSTRRDLGKCFANVRTLVLQDVAFSGNDFLLLLCACPNLYALHMREVDWRYRGLPPDTVIPVPAGRSRLEMLTVHSLSWAAAAYLPAAFNNLALRRLDVSWEDIMRSSSVRAILQASATTLEHLTLRPFIKIDPTFVTEQLPPKDKPIIDLSRHVRLLTLCVQLDLDQRFGDERYDYHRALCEILASLQALAPRLRTVDIELICLNYHPSRLDVLVWDAIDGHLARLLACQPRLAVKLRVHDTNSKVRGDSKMDVVNAVLKWVPQLEKTPDQFEVEVMWTHGVERGGRPSDELR
ncbi:uncharacterized protein LAESUDRAFT_758596 [Laetiporus sulphureus 93-53]|uniref:F-box domain-containing protein n=1 Tax=Laetiporus sulphureus 93-53 TaxID=1314785 RepID=A0A165EJD9_9APHY|nr:uncharacterized protein LAESUDRAFT_758596 [Laetiporus sulphureus 93-53]KZT07173.1 hypothetical protein LAESUDRAFT_758596 [Laetiporus sulphureus 93-53]